MLARPRGDFGVLHLSFAAGELRLPSKRKLQRHLHQPRCCRRNNPSEIVTADIAVHRGGSIKLRVIQSIERFHAELECFSFCQIYVLQQRQINILDPWPIEEAPIGCTQRAQRGRLNSAVLNAFLPERGFRCRSKLPGV